MNDEEKRKILLSMSVKDEDSTSNSAYIEDSVERDKSLEDVFNMYKEYTGYEDEYDSNTFSRKLRDTVKYYHLKNYIKCFNEEREAYVGYKFSEDEAKILALFLACTTTTDIKNKDKYRCSTLNPLTRGKKKSAKLGITDLLICVENFVSHTNDFYKYDLNFSELSDIVYFIKFIDIFRKEFTNMITAMFNIRSYNDQVFELIIRRIHAFTQELNLFNALCGECVPELRKKIWDAYEKNPVCPLEIQEKYDNLYKKYESKFYSVDVSVAASMADVFEKNEYNNSNIHNLGDLIHIHKSPYEREKLAISKMDYRQYLKKRIRLIIEDYCNLIKEMPSEEELKTKSTDAEKEALKKWKDKFLREFCKEHGISPYTFASNGYSTETLIFEMYINPGIDRVISGQISIDGLSKEIAEKLDELFKQIDSKNSDIIQGEYYKELSEQMNRLLLIPFHQLHKIDVEELRDRIGKERPLSNY